MSDILIFSKTFKKQSDKIHMYSIYLYCFKDQMASHRYYQIKEKEKSPFYLYLQPNAPLEDFT